MTTKGLGNNHHEDHMTEYERIGSEIDLQRAGRARSHAQRLKSTQ
jgi:hypothetical protein